MDSINHTKKIFCVGLTGGIGSGKTTVANAFAKLGVPIIDADQIAHDITNPEKPAYQKIIAHFGKSILQPNNAIDRKKLRELIFNQPTERQWLENTLHPLIRSEMKKIISTITSPYCICVIPLLAESTGIDFIDRVLVVNASLEKQISRAQLRDKATAEQIKKMINAQAHQTKRLKIADDIIQNEDDNIASLDMQIHSLHQQYLSLAKQNML